MNGKLAARRRIIVWVILILLLCTAVTGVRMLLGAEVAPTLQAAWNPDDESTDRINGYIGLRTDPDIVLAERWRNRETALIIYFTDIQLDTFAIPDYGKVRYDMRKYNPVSGDYESGILYQAGAEEIFFFDVGGIRYARYQKSLAGSGEISSLAAVFRDSETHSAGELEEYDVWRPDIAE